MLERSTRVKTYTKRGGFGGPGPSNTENREDIDDAGLIHNQFHYHKQEFHKNGYEGHHVPSRGFRGRNGVRGARVRREEEDSFAQGVRGARGGHHSIRKPSYIDSEDSAKNSYHSRNSGSDRGGYRGRGRGRRGRGRGSRRDDLGGPDNFVKLLFKFRGDIDKMEENLATKRLHSSTKM